MVVVLDIKKPLNVQVLVQLAQKRMWVMNTKEKEKRKKKNTEAEERREQRSSLFRAEVKVTHSKKSAVSSQVDPSFILFLAL